MASRLREANGWTAWIADSPAGIVGAIWLQEVEKIPNPNGEPDRFGYISNLYVRPAARGGVGERLLQACLGAIAPGTMDYVLLWPSERSRTLYRRFGFTVTADLVVQSVCMTTHERRGSAHEEAPDDYVSD